MHYAVFLVGDYYLYYALRSNFSGLILFILCTTQYIRGMMNTILLCTAQYFRGVDTIYTMPYAVFLVSEYYLYNTLRSIFGGWILFILCTMQYFRWVDTIYTMHYAVFSGGGYSLYYALRSIFGE